MPEFQYKEIPSFTIRDGEALLFNEDGYLEYYIPEDYFGDGKSTSASIEGLYVTLMGSFNYRIISASGSKGKLMTFNFPSRFICRPSKIEKMKDVQLEEEYDSDNYRILTFYKGDQLITRCHVEQDVGNLAELFRLHIQTGRIPNTIPYNTLYNYPLECMRINTGKAYAMHSQPIGILYSKICRDPDDVSIPFRLSKKAKTSMTGYESVSIKVAAKHISPFVSITSENMDESIMSAVLLSEDEKNGKIKHKESPLERVLTM